MKRRLVLGLFLLVIGLVIVMMDTVITVIVGVILLVVGVLVASLRDLSWLGEEITITTLAKSFGGLPLLVKHRGYVIYSKSSVAKHGNRFNRIHLNDNSRISFYGKNPVADSIWVGPGFTPIYIFNSQGVQVYPQLPSDSES